MPAEPIVTPSCLQGRKLPDYWRRAEQLAQRYAAGLPEPLSADARFALWCLCVWPTVAIDDAGAWRGWDRHFDSAMLARIDGCELVRDGIAPWLEDADPEAVLDGVRDYVRWLGACAGFDADQAERVCAELEAGRAQLLAAVAAAEHVDLWARVDADVARCASEDSDAVAPFVHWLLDTTTFSLERRLLGQALAISALHQLGAKRLRGTDFYSLDLAGALSATCDRVQLKVPERRELATVGRAFVLYLEHRCGLSAFHTRRMQALAERWVHEG